MAVAPPNPAIARASCPNCGYSCDRSKDDETPCPECGARADLSSISTSALLATERGLRLLIWGLGALIFSATIAMAVWIPFGNSTARTTLVYVPLAAIAAPLMLACVALWILADALLSDAGKRWTRLAIWTALAVLSLALVARLEVGSHGRKLDPIDAIGFRDDQLASLSLMLFVGCLVLLSSPLRAALGRTFELLGQPRISARLRRGLVVLPVVLILLLLGLEFEARLRDFVFPQRSVQLGSPPPARPSPETQTWLTVHRWTFLFAPLVLHAFLIFSTILLWACAALAHHRLKLLRAQPPA